MKHRLFRLFAVATGFAALPAGAAPPTAAANGPIAPQLDLAYGAYQRGYYVTAFREATARLDRDPKDAAAMTLIGELYNQGLGVGADPRRAVDWYRLAARAGDAHAMASLGLMAIDGRGTAKDAQAGRDWLERASAEGEPAASYNLALLLLSAGPTEAPRAARLMRVAAEAEIADAQHGLGVLFARGEGVNRDPAEAAAWFLRAARNGSIAGTVEYAIAAFNGDGTVRSEAEGIRFFRRAASRGNAIAQNRLARIFATGRGLPKNLVEAAAWHLVASAQGLTDPWLDAAVSGLSAADRSRAEAIAADRAERT